MKWKGLSSTVSGSIPVLLPLLIAIVACVDSLDLGSSEQAAIVPLQDHDFGSVQVGTASAPRTFTITPASGEQSDEITSITENCPDFSLTAPGLPATVSNVCTGGSNCTGFEATTYSFDAVFTPTVAAQVSCVVTVVIDTVPTTFTLTGLGTQPMVKFDVSPSADLDIGQVRVGETATTSVLIRNFGSGPAPMTVSSVAFDAPSLARGFSVSSGTTSPHVVAANGGSDPYTVSCAPAVVGALTGTLRILTDDPTASTITLAFTCTGIDSTLAFLPSAPAQLAGTQVQQATRVGEPINVPIAVFNVGTASMTINSVSVAGTQLSLVSGPAAGTTLAPDASTNVVLRFSAATPIAQGSIGTLTVNHDTNQVRSINVVGAALATTMSITPDGEVDLGPICIGDTATKSFFVLKNNPGTFKITAIDQPAAPFLLTGMLPAGSPLNVDNNAVSFSASVTPSEPSELISTFSVTTDIPNEPPRVIRLSAIGLAPGVTPTPAGLDLGTVSVGATSIGQMVTLTNCGSGPLTLLESLIGGPNQDDFVVSSSPISATVAAGESAVYVIVARPNNAGGLMATLQIRYDAGTAEIPLVGSATGKDPNRVLEPSTYYSLCSAGTGHAAWPVGVVILLLLRRRRRR